MRFIRQIKIDLYNNRFQIWTGYFFFMSTLHPTANKSWLNTHQGHSLEVARSTM